MTTGFDIVEVRDDGWFTFTLADGVLTIPGLPPSTRCYGNKLSGVARAVLLFRFPGSPPMGTIAANGGSLDLDLPTAAVLWERAQRCVGMARA